jgi:osmotically inducible protein OsmC
MQYLKENAMESPRIVLDKILYTATASANAGRNGRAKSDDGNLDVAIVPPQSLGGSGAGTNPEQLFAAGYAACFGSALGVVAQRQKIKTGPVNVIANVKLGQTGPGFGLAVELVVEMPEVPREQGEALIRTAHEVCPYSNATRGNIAVDLRLA